MLLFSINFKKKLIISSDVSSSKLPVISSANIKSGLLISALAEATRCCSPPDNLFGLISFLSSIPKVSNKSQASLLTYRFFIFIY